MTYEELLIQSDSKDIMIKEIPLIADDGRLCGNRIAIRQDIPTQTEKSCILAEELGHYHTTYGDILDQTDTGNRKQELRARMWAYDRQIGLLGIIRCFESGCQSQSEMAEFLDVTEDFLREALERYRQKYGICASVDQYIIYFEPSLAVARIDGP